MAEKRSKETRVTVSMEQRKKTIKSADNAGGMSVRGDTLNCTIPGTTRQRRVSKSEIAKLTKYLNVAV